LGAEALALHRDVEDASERLDDPLEVGVGDVGVARNI
jgi:hypothetical protein